MNRYPAYKDSGVEWIGEIPEHWRVIKLKYLTKEIRTGSTPPSDRPDYFLEEFDWFTPSDFTDKIKLGEAKRKVALLAVSDGVVKVFSPYSVLMIGIGATLGKVGYLTAPGSSNQQINSIFFQREAEAIFYSFFLSVNRESIVSFTNSATLPILNQSQTGSIQVPLPPPEEQTVIAAYLDEKTAQIDDLVAKKQRLIELLKEERTALINQAVTKGIDPDVKLKPSGIDWLGNIPAHWEVKKLKYLASKVGSGVTPKGGANVYLDEGIPLLRSQNVHNEGLMLDDVAFISEEVDEEMSNSRVQEGDVLLNITGASIGRCTFVPKGFGPGNVNQHVCIIRPNPELVIAEYLHFFLISDFGQTSVDSFQTGANREGLNFQQIKSFTLPIPSTEEQELIVESTLDKLRGVDHTVLKVEKEIALLQEYRTALISEVVTGKVKVT